MSLNGCARDLAMGLASGIAGWVVTTQPSGQLMNFHWLGWIAVAAGVISIWLGGRVRVHESDSMPPAQGELDVPPSVSASSTPLSPFPLESEPSIEN